MKRLIFLSIFVAFLASCTSTSTDKAASDNAPKVLQERVKTMILEQKKIARSVDYTATLLAFEEIHLAPASPGRIEGVNVEIGSRVAAGTVLVQMDRTQLHQAEVQLRTLETDYKRLDTLRKVGSIAQQQYDQLKAQYEISRANVEFLRRNIQLVAPFSGVISGKYFEAGEMYSGAPVAAIGKAAIVSLVQINKLKTLVAISEKFFPQIKQGMEANITADTYPGKIFKGRIFNIHPTVDPGSRTFNAEIVIDNREGLLRPGMFCRANLELDQVEALVVPAIAVLKMQGSNERYLFIEEDGVAHRIGVQVGKRYDDQLEVISDRLKPGDQIIVSGQARLLDGVAITVVND